jgi:hypothetical protein
MDVCVRNDWVAVAAATWFRRSTETIFFCESCTQWA